MRDEFDFERLIAPVGTRAFFRDYYEQRHIVVKREVLSFYK